MNTSFWNSKKVLITGHSGFKGSWLTLLLNYLGAQVCGISSSALNNNQELFHRLNLEDSCISYDLDIRDETITDVFNNFKPEIVFHLAAQPLVRASYEIPFETYETNVMGTLNVLENLRKSSSVVASVLITTDKCYENKEWDRGYKENDRLGGYDPYSSSKACAELLIKSYQQSFASESLAISSVRAGNVIGGGDLSVDRLLPDIYRAIQSNQKITLRNPKATRPWQHVLEPLSGYLLLGHKLINNELKNDILPNWNFGPKTKNCKNVEFITKIIIKNWKKIKINILINNKKKYHESKFLSLNIQKAKKELNWEPRLNLIETLKLTVDWYKIYFENKKIEHYTSKQIDYFLNK